MAISPTPAAAEENIDNEYCVGFFFWHGREKKMDLDKSVVFVNDGVTAYLDLAIPAPCTYTAYAFPLDIVEKDLSRLKATPKADIMSPEI